MGLTLGEEIRASETEIVMILVNVQSAMNNEKRCTVLLKRSSLAVCRARRLYEIVTMP